MEVFSYRYVCERKQTSWANYNSCSHSDHAYYGKAPVSLPHNSMKWYYYPYFTNEETEAQKDNFFKDTQLRRDGS
jgi:hypothetical protein